MIGDLPFLSTEEAAEILGIHPESLRRLRRQGDLPDGVCLGLIGGTAAYDRDATAVYAAQYKAEAKRFKYKTEAANRRNAKNSTAPKEPPSPCKVCEDKHYALGLCRRCYRYERRTGELPDRSDRPCENPDCGAMVNWLNRTGRCAPCHLYFRANGEDRVVTAVAPTPSDEAEPELEIDRANLDMSICVNHPERAVSIVTSTGLPVCGECFGAFLDEQMGKHRERRKKYQKVLSGLPSKKKVKKKSLNVRKVAPLGELTQEKIERLYFEDGLSVVAIAREVQMSDRAVLTIVQRAAR